MSDPTILQLQGIETEPIERIEEGENQVRYTSIRLIAPGVWTDSGSRKTIWYSPEGMKNLEVTEDNVANIMHDADNEVSAAGRIDPESAEGTEDGLYADIVLDTSNAAGQYADENLQKTLETQGAKGFGGPSVEISAEGQQVEYNAEKGMNELKAGRVTGVGMVKNPAAKSVSFARQTAQKGVALADSERTTMVLEQERSAMNPDNLRAKLSDFGFDLEDKEDEELQALADKLLEDDPDEEEDDEEEEEKEQADDEEGEESEGEEEDDEENEEPEMAEVAQTVQALQERVQNLEDMAESMMAAEDVQESLEEFEQDLADAETVSELSEAKEDLEKRLSELEDEPKEPRSLADAEGESDGLEGSPQLVGEFDSRRRTYSR